MTLSKKLAKRILEKPEELERVVELLTKYRLLGLLPEIKKSFLLFAKQQADNASLRIEAPFPLDEKSIAKIKTLTGGEKNHTVTINKELLAGFRARHSGVLYDGSAKRIITNLLNK